MKTKHPLPEAIYLAVEAVEKTIAPLIKKPKKQFDISECNVNKYGYPCGTIHCAGGWFAVALCDLSRTVDFNDGAAIFANAIGFTGKDELKLWAKETPSLWGNRNGNGMFCISASYRDKGIKTAKSMQDVLNHWRRVAQRIEEYNAKKK